MAMERNPPRGAGERCCGWPAGARRSGRDGAVVSGAAVRGFLKSACLGRRWNERRPGCGSSRAVLHLVSCSERAVPPLIACRRSMLEKPSSWLFVRCADRISPPRGRGEGSWWPYFLAASTISRAIASATASVVRPSRSARWKIAVRVSAMRATRGVTVATS